MSHKKSLVFVQILFRHGNRTPALTYAKDVYRFNTYQPYGPGQLTHKGKLAAYHLGERLRELYGWFLGNVYFKNMMCSVSSGVHRSEMSLQCVHAGLFPPPEDIHLVPGLAWQPIPYDVLSRRGDKYLGLIAYDNRLLDVFKKLSPETKELYALISKNTGEIIKNTHGFFKVHNTIQVQEELGYEPPEWINCISREQWNEESLNFWEDLANYRISDIGGPLVRLMTNNFRGKIMESKELRERKMCLFSGHDINIVAILGVLNAFIREEIDYCAFISLELHHIDDEYLIKVLYQNGLKAKLRQLKPCKEKSKDGLYAFEDFVACTKWMYTH